MPRVSPPSTAARPFYRSLAPLLRWQELPRPIDWRAQFGRAAPLVVEIGTGNGEFLARESAAHPEHDHVGIDLRWSSVKRTLRNLEKGRAPGAAARDNVRIVLDDVRPVLERAFAPRSIARAVVLFPCPWRKDQHEKHRLFHRDFCELLNSRLIDGGEALLVTDWTPFAEWTLAQLPGTGFDVERRVIAAAFDTKYERKWQALGRGPFHELTLRKADHRDVPPRQEVELNPPHLAALDLERLAPAGLSGPITVTFKEIVRDPVRQIAMVRAVVVEEPLTQHVWITVARDRDGSWWIVPSRGCAMVPTAGLQAALERVAEAGRASVAAAG